MRNKQRKEIVSATDILLCGLTPFSFYIVARARARVCVCVCACVRVVVDFFSSTRGGWGGGGGAGGVVKYVFN